MLFYYLCDLIVYEQFFWNDLPADCLSEASCSGNASVFYEDTFFQLSKEEIKKVADRKNCEWLYNLEHKE